MPREISERIARKTCIECNKNRQVTCYKKGEDICRYCYNEAGIFFNPGNGDEIKVYTHKCLGCDSLFKTRKEIAHICDECKRSPEWKYPEGSI